LRRSSLICRVSGLLDKSAQHGGSIAFAQGDAGRATALSLPSHSNTAPRELRQKPGHFPGCCGKLDVMASPRKKSGDGSVRILVLHGPNLNLLGTREPSIYGADTLQSINTRLTDTARAAGAELTAFQSNFEGELIGRIHQAKADGTAFILINPAGFTHTSVALRDALAGVNIPFIEVHLSNVFAREPFRHHSFFTDLAVGMVCGLGARGYELALQYALEHRSQGRAG
jgi:3-dehydroquinate dehydratase-2